MKTKEFTVDKAFWWAPNLRVAEKPGCKSWCTRIPLEGQELTTTYYCDAPVEAMTEYLNKKQCDINGPFKVVMTVKTKNGEEHVYNVQIGEMNFATKDLDELHTHLVQPTVLTLVRQAGNELEFNKVVSVTAYVEEGDTSEI
jgi:hypothetical protein